MTREHMTGKLIVIDGLDGSGKATQAELLYEELKESRIPVQKVSFPNYESDSSALVRMYLNGELGSHPDDVNAYAASTFYAVDRYASYQKEWKPFLESGESGYGRSGSDGSVSGNTSTGNSSTSSSASGGIVIADRYTTSNAIHQCSKLPEEQWDSYLDWLFDFEYRLLGVPEPTLVIYLHVNLEVSQRLLSGRYEGSNGKDGFIHEKDLHEKDMDYLQRSQKAAGYCAEKYGWSVIECCRNGEMKSMEEIREEILQVVRSVII